MISIPTDASFISSLNPLLVIIVILFVTGATEFLKRIKLVKQLERFIDEPAWFVALLVAWGVSYKASVLLPIELVEALGKCLAALAVGFALTIPANITSRFIPKKKKAIIVEKSEK